MPVKRQLDPKAVAEARRKFEANIPFAAHCKMTLSFDEFLELFSNDCVRFSEIAEQLSATRQAVTKLYNRYFRNLLGDRSGNERSKICFLKHRIVAQNEVKKKMPAHSLIEYISKKAAKCGLSSERIPLIDSRNYMQGFLKSALRINGKNCQVRRATSAPKYNDNAHYSILEINREPLQKWEYIIFRQQLVKVDRIYVIPSADLLELLGAGDVKSVYIRVEEKKNTSYPVQIDFQKYLENWDQLK